MATRYYYTDPLMAANMAKCFGMEFTDKTGKLHFKLRIHEDENAELNGRLDYSDFFFVTMGLYEPIEDGTIFYIRPDSLHLLEPKEDDLVFYFYTEEAMTSDYDGDISLSGYGSYRRTDIPSYVAKIILRDGKPFHWPEGEEIV